MPAKENHFAKGSIRKFSNSVPSFHLLVFSCLPKGHQELGCSFFKQIKTLSIIFPYREKP
jgi:hypothetical protein